MRTQLDDDINHARLNARNCLILEKRDLRHGRHELNVGTADEPRLVPTADAWQHAYALWVLAELDRPCTSCSTCRNGRLHDEMGNTPKARSI